MFAAALFAYRPPRFGFSVAQQDVLALALTRLADQEIAGALFISEHALKKRWEQIFERVERIDPSFFPQVPTATRRGPEKRTRLLTLLSDHSEELRPTTRCSFTHECAAAGPRTENLQRGRLWLSSVPT